jgi:hypothetical protein
MAVIQQPFTSFAPDLPVLSSPNLVRANNCSAGIGATQGAVTLFPLKSAALFSSTSMSSRPLGTAIGMDRDGNSRVYGGSAGKLYHLSSATRLWTDISRAGGYTTTGTEKWKFIEYGNLMIGTNWNDVPQFVDMNLNIQWGNLTSLVRGRHIATYKGFVLLADTTDSIDGNVKYRVRWSALENASDWNYSVSTMADFQDIRGMSAVMGICVDESCYVILKRGIVRMSFVGSPLIFQFDDVSVGKGCSVSQSLISVGNQHFFLSNDGFYMLSANGLTPIGQGKVDRFFLDDIDTSQAHLMSVTADPRSTLIYWQYVSKSSVTGKPDRVLIYNYTTGLWTTADATTDYVFNSVSLSWTIDQLDTFLSINAVPSSVDSPAFAGGDQSMWGMSSTGAVYSFSGPTLPLSVETPEYHLSATMPNETGADMSLVNAVRPLFEGNGTARVQVGTRKRQKDPIVFGPLVECNPETDFAYLRSNSRYHRFRVTIDGDWTKAYALEIDGQTAGKR